MSSQPDELNLPPFPLMSWGDYDLWEGEIDLDCGGGAALSVTPYDPEASRQPEAFQCEAMAFHLARGSNVTLAVLAALLPYYQKMRPRYLNFLGEQANRLMPEAQAADELRSLIDLRHVHIHPWSRDGIGYVGLQFGCTWDVEHGLGFMMHLDRVVQTGGADVSFAWKPAESSPSA
jgi:hypothetical protein